MQYHHTEIWPTRLPDRGVLPGGWEGIQPGVVDEHLRLWAEAGWQLVAANTFTVPINNGMFLVHSFFWGKPDDDAFSGHSPG
jgi:hypothetical protein